MKKIDHSIRYSASDLVNYLGCKHLTELDRQKELGHIKAQDWSNPSLELIQQKGKEHEKAIWEIGIMEWKILSWLGKQRQELFNNFV